MLKPIPSNWIWVMKPRLVYEDYLFKLNTDEWIIEPKINGARALVYWFNGNVEIWNRHQHYIKPSQIPNIYTQLNEMFKPVLRPQFVVLDGELEYRKGKEKLWLFDCLYYDQPIFNSPIESRKQQLRTLDTSNPFITIIPELKGKSLSEIWNTLPPEYEGIVLKAKGSRYLPAKNEYNNQSVYWLKVRKKK